MRDKLRGQRVYFDTNIFIYLLEGSQELAVQVEVLREAIKNKEFTVFASDLIFTEILPPLVRTGDQKTINQVLEFLENNNIVSLVPLSREICIQAGVLRGELGMKAPDALHVASAIAAGCTAFFTNDLSLKVPKTILKIGFEAT